MAIIFFFGANTFCSILSYLYWSKAVTILTYNAFFLQTSVLSLKYRTSIFLTPLLMATVIVFYTKQD